jgi:uncharacterized protein (TIGR03435 family)
MLAGRIIVNQTDLAGTFDIELRFDPNTNATAPSTDLPSFFTAVREQLGLRLDPRTGPVEVFVIEAIERPTEN